MKITEIDISNIESEGEGCSGMLEGWTEYFSCLNPNEVWEFPPSSEDIQNIVEETSVIDEHIRAGIQFYLSTKAKIDNYV